MAPHSRGYLRHPQEPDSPTTRRGQAMAHHSRGYLRHSQEPYSGKIIDNYDLIPCPDLQDFKCWEFWKSWKIDFNAAL